MFSRLKTRQKLISGADPTAVTSILVVLAVALLWIQTGLPVSDPGVGPDLPKVGWSHPVPLVSRDDAIVITIMRDGKVFFRNNQMAIEEVPAAIRLALTQGAEKRIYIQADARARYREIAEVVDSAGVTGVANISFLVTPR